MKVSHVERLATHNDSESCTGIGNDASEALTGVRVGWVLSRERNSLRGADPVGEWGRPHQRKRYREFPLDPARSETPCMHGCTLHGNRDVPQLPAKDGSAGRIGKSKDVRR
jgi:hypothetical protein